MTEESITQEQLKELFSYNKETGALVYRATNVEAGWKSRDYNTSYRLVQINRRTYKAHRIIWFYVFGTWPNNQIDHIDRNGLNNKLNNLRDVTARENSKNRCKYKNTRISGISWDNKMNKWRVRLNCDGLRKHIGYVEDYFEACCLLKASALNK